MYKIGEFSAITGLSVKTLRYYDEIGLLKPSNVDDYTNYRYYTNDQIKQFKRIEYLKRLGFTLEEIKNNLPNMTVKCIEQKKQELITKRDIIIAQIYELNTLKENLTNGKIKTLTRS